MSVGGHIETVRQEQDLQQLERLCRTDHHGNDGPSHVSVSGHLDSGVLGIVGTTVRHWGLVLLLRDRTGDAPFIPYDPNGIVSVLTYIFLTQIPIKLAMLKHLFLEF